MTTHRRLLLAAAVLAALPGCSVPGGSEWLIIAFIALLLFGGAKLPSLMRSMGSGINEFKKGLKEGEGDDDDDPDKKEIDAGSREKAGERS